MTMGLLKRFSNDSNGKKRGKVKEVIITNYENNMSFDENEG